MFLLFPLSIETLERQRPWVNWLILAMTVFTFFGSGMGGLVSEAWRPWVLDGWEPAGMLGHLFLHAGIWHLAGNMVFLWVFGNVICQTTSNWIYPLLYFGAGMGAAAIHLVVDGRPAIGASGAISGLTGLTLAMFPLNHVNIFYLVGTRGGTFEIKVITLCIISMIWDLAGATILAGKTAHWAHMGGLVTGAGIGLLCLHFGWIKLSCFDGKSLYEMLTGRELERLQDEVDTGRD
jgi:membrane associated rhomboid family serine protease